MKALVAIKRVPDGNIPVRLKPDGSGVDMAGVPMRVNPFDEAALEKAIQWKEAGLVEEIVAVTIGDSGSQEALRHALALGADRAVRIDTHSTLEPLALARLLQAIVQQEAPDLVMLGKQSSDTGCAQVGPMLAGLLGWPQGCFASAMQMDAGQLRITREIEGGQETLALPLPAVITADLRLANPRYVKLPQLLQAKKKNIEILAAAELANLPTPDIKTLRVAAPPPRRPARHTHSAAELLNWLRQEGLREASITPSQTESDLSRPRRHVLVLAEHDGHTLHASTRCLLSAARRLGDTISLLVAGHAIAPIANAASEIAGVNQVLMADDPALAHRPEEPLAALLAQCAHQTAATVLLAATSAQGKATLPRTAALLDCPMLSDIIAIDTPDTMAGPIHAGEVLATWHNTSQVQILSLRPASYPPAGQQVPALIQCVEMPHAGRHSHWIEQIRTHGEWPKLSEARIVVSGGSGLQSAEKFQTVIAPLASRLGAAIGATLSAVDAGFVDNAAQIGQTGTIVAPEFYFAIGLSGAAQHLAGMRDSRIIVAINKDPCAPICRHADYVLEGDLFEQVPELVKLLES